MTEFLPNPCNNSRKEWRKLVKKLRRKRIRKEEALNKEKLLCELSVNIEENEPEPVKFDEDDDERQLRHLKWVQDEEKAQKSWRERQAQQLKIEMEKKQVRERIQKEWELARLQKLQKKEEEKRKLDELNEKIEYFIAHGGTVPQELLTIKETNPGKEPCPFFSKVAACRFGPACSRNHVIPGISKTLLIPNFYTHFTLYQARSAEYDTDVGLEFDETEMKKDFQEFFNDIVSELERIGDLRVLQVCKNSEPHLRGNVYVEYEEERAAVAAARNLNARWYAGRQITVQFALVPDWGAAVCGEFHRGRCPKGNQCNFLHTLRNPRGFLMPRKKDLSETPSRSWRWSESPERSSKRQRTKSPSRERQERRKKSSSRDHHERRSRTRTHSRNRTTSRSSDHPSAHGKKESNIINNKLHKNNSPTRYVKSSQPHKSSRSRS